ncbi:MAG: aldehyde dehydrogenase family protein, partial [Actinomycetales bacterium]|nr:aldehyde dehydrogenase family protein [Actinomycetales bacterium]
MDLITHYIDGKPWDAPAGRTGQVFDPARGVQTSEVALADAATVDAAVAAAARAFESWRHVSLAQRASVMFAFREILNARKEELAAAITAEHG